MSGRIYSLQSPLVDTTRFASTWFEFLLMNGRYSCFSERNKKKHRSMTHCCLAKHTCTHSTRCQTSFATFELHGSYRGQYQQKKIKETCCYHDFAVISFLSGSRAIQKKKCRALSSCSWIVYFGVYCWLIFCFVFISKNDIWTNKQSVFVKIERNGLITWSTSLKQIRFIMNNQSFINSPARSTFFCFGRIGDLKLTYSWFIV